MEPQETGWAISERVVPEHADLESVDGRVLEDGFALERLLYLVLFGDRWAAGSEQ